MTLAEFKDTLSESNPPEKLNLSLKALWWDANDEWDKAHSIVQDLEETDAYWVHAYLHRVEGDLGNSNYWYSRAGRKMPQVSLSVEWDAIAKELLAR
jgi:hypothetical protein